MKRLVKVTFKRRREGKTDYKARARLLKSGVHRLVVRKTNKYLIAQIVRSKEAQDFTVVYANSKELEKLGWKFDCKNIPAAYLTGLLVAQKAKKKNIDKVIVDMGLYRSTLGSRIYAAVKGVLDGGVKIPCKTEMLPDEKRIKGNHIRTKTKKEEIEKIFNQIKEKIIK